MLTPLQAGEFDRWLGFAWALAQDPSRSGYPLYADGVKTKSDFTAAARRARDDENAEILLFRRGGAVEGWLQAYWLPGDRYLSLDACCVRAGTAQALAEFLAWARARFPGYCLTLGFPAANAEAARFLAAHGFACAERAFHNVLPLAEYGAPRAAPLRRATAECFSDFRRLHAPYERDMYWTSDRLLAHLDAWHILLLDAPAAGGSGGPDCPAPPDEAAGGISGASACPAPRSPIGAVYFTGAGPSTLEIFGLDCADGHGDADTRRALLAGAADACRRLGAAHLLFLCGADCQPAVRPLGFRLVGEYECWETRL